MFECSRVYRHLSLGTLRVPFPKRRLDGHRHYTTSHPALIYCTEDRSETITIDDERATDETIFRIWSDEKRIWMQRSIFAFKTFVCGVCAASRHICFTHRLLLHAFAFTIVCISCNFFFSLLSLECNKSYRAVRSISISPCAVCQMQQMVASRTSGWLDQCM